MSSYFDVFGISPLRLCLSQTDLEASYYRMSLQFHPDKNQNSTDSIKQSSEINLAYKVLRDPWARALYVLGQFGMVRGSKVPPSLAEVYFELQDLNDRAKLESLREVLSQGRIERSQKLHELFADFDQHQLTSFASAAEGVRPVLLKLQDLVLENTYANSMLRDIDQRLGSQAA